MTGKLMEKKEMNIKSTKLYERKQRKTIEWKNTTTVVRLVTFT